MLTGVVDGCARRDGGAFQLSVPTTSRRVLEAVVKLRQLYQLSFSSAMHPNGYYLSTSGTICAIAGGVIAHPLQRTLLDIEPNRYAGRDMVAVHIF